MSKTVVNILRNARVTEVKRLDSSVLELNLFTFDNSNSSI